MPSPTDELRAANLTLSTRADRDLLAFWASLDLSKPERARDALLRYIPVLTSVYGTATATVAADWYDGLRLTEKVPGRFAAVMASAYSTDYVKSRVKFGAAHLFTETPGDMLPFLQGAVQKYALQPGRDTIQRSSEADPQSVGWHREASGGACKFCRMLAGRGGVYRKERSARFAAHGDCNCTARPSWDADAPEVPVSAYVASQRTSAMTPAQKDVHNATIRDFMASMDD